MPTIDKKRLKRLEGLDLSAGSHSPPNGEFNACVMEAAAYVAGEEWTDQPECVSPVIAAFMRRWNDDLDDEGRQMLKPYITKVIGTRDDRDEERAWMAIDWLEWRELAEAIPPAYTEHIGTYLMAAVKQGNPVRW